MRERAWVFWLVVLGLFGAGGGGGYFAWKKIVGERRARIQKMSMYTPGNGLGAIRVDFDLVFGEPPGDGDPRDVRLEITSELLTESLDYDWDFISSHVVFREKPADPPPGEVLQVRIPLQEYLKPRVQDLGISDFALRAKLFWAGKQQDRDSYNLRMLYEKER